jgi:pyrimidine operon attenuation protein/uracil phosphoribosyltransferase
VDLPLGELDPAPFRDDVAPGDRPEIDQTAIPFSVAGSTAILVDDVLYTGRTIRAALDALMTLGRPARVQVAALVDRGHRELPIRADYVGKNLPTAREQRVAVRLDECDASEGVWIETGARSESDSR